MNKSMRLLDPNPSGGGGISNISTPVSTPSNTTSVSPGSANLGEGTAATPPTPATKVDLTGKGLVPEGVERRSTPIDVSKALKLSQSPNKDIAKMKEKEISKRPAQTPFEPKKDPTDEPSTTPNSNPDDKTLSKKQGEDILSEGEAGSGTKPKTEDPSSQKPPVTPATGTEEKIKILGRDYVKGSKEADAVMQFCADRGINPFEKQAPKQPAAPVTQPKPQATPQEIALQKAAIRKQEADFITNQLQYVDLDLVPSPINESTMDVFLAGGPEALKLMNDQRRVDALNAAMISNKMMGHQMNQVIEAQEKRFAELTSRLQPMESQQRELAQFELMHKFTAQFPELKGQVERAKEIGKHWAKTAPEFMRSINEEQFLQHVAAALTKENQDFESRATAMGLVKQPNGDMKNPAGQVITKEQKTEAVSSAAATTPPVKKVLTPKPLSANSPGASSPNGIGSQSSPNFQKMARGSVAGLR